LSRADEFAAVFQRMVDAPAAQLDALRADAAAFEQSVLAEEDGRHQPRAAIPQRGALAFLLFDVHGNPLALESPAWLPGFASFEALMAQADTRSSDGRLICFPGVDERLVFALWATLQEAASWNLPAAVRQAAEGKPGCRIVLVAGGGTEPLLAAAEAFGLSPLQQRVVAAVVRTGNVRQAASALGLSYTTARETIAGAAKRMSLPNTPAVVQAVVEASFGILPGDVDRAFVLTEMLAITHRQARIALLISSGSSREEVARAVGVSPAVVKKELELLFGNFGLQSAAEMSRLIVEIQALALFTRSIDGAPGFLNPAIEPSRITVRRGGKEKIAWSDYGPASGKPVLVVHSNWSCRAAPRPLVAELQRRGWRPIAIDRPGYGGTSLGASTAQDPFSQAVTDVLQVLDQCRIESIPVIARCGAQFVHVMKAAAPERVGPVVLVSPTPQTRHGGQRVGVAGAFKEAFFRRPRLIEFFFRIIGAQLSLRRVEQLTRAIAKGSPVDERLCEDPQFIRDRFRALQPFATGNFIGGVLEEYVISHGGWDFAPLEVDDWIILQGTQDNHNNVEEVTEYWFEKLPRTPVVAVDGAGRFMTSSHASQIVDQLERLSS
jgi:pimeloyl-ACP methyl ester carboxylesterase/DNA-binding CsgD family transcriptional regulator